MVATCEGGRTASINANRHRIVVRSIGDPTRICVTQMLAQSRHFDRARLFNSGNALRGKPDHGEGELPSRQRISALHCRRVEESFVNAEKQ
jgi:hypothetical protein